jgi:hypothetical protein
MGLGQGNGVALPGFFAVCTHMISICHNLGYGVILLVAGHKRPLLWLWCYVWMTRTCFIWHKALLDDEFLAMVQSATNDWSTHACYWGVAQAAKNASGICFLDMRERQSSAQVTFGVATTLLILQPDGRRVPISVKKASDPEKKLGVYTCPTRDFSHHIEQLVSASLACAERLCAWKLPARDAWMETWYQLFPKLIYAVVAVTHSPQKLEDAYQSICYKLLPSFCVNRNITNKYRMLPLHYQGLALPNPNIEVLS